MKKHFYGFLLFAFIVGFSAMIYGYFVGFKPVAVNYEYKCRMRYNPPPKPASASVNLDTESVVVDLTQNKVFTKVNLKWNGYGTKPETVSVQTNILTGDDLGRNLAAFSNEVKAPFINGRETTVTVENSCTFCARINPRVNEYASVNLISGESNLITQSVTQTKPVLIIAGNRKY
jgi:hypothetical protein